MDAHRANATSRVVVAARHATAAARSAARAMQRPENRFDFGAGRSRESGREGKRDAASRAVRDFERTRASERA